MCASQYGYRNNYSTEHAGIELTDRILNSMDNGDIPFAVFMDLSKAFDTIDHKILLHKLKFYGFSDSALKLITSYLSNRSQFVVFDSFSSKLNSITTGVPQGSILGPILFLIYINDLSRATSILDTISFADDTTLLGHLNKIRELISDGKTCSDIINDELSKVYDWLIVNKLSLNVSKTEYMIFHQPGKRFEKLFLSINSISIELTDIFRFLGLTLDTRLSWKHHLNRVCSKISSAVGVLNRLKKLLPKNVLFMIYNSLVLPYMNYCLVCWGSINTNRILLLQKKAVRAITNSHYIAHCDPIFKNLNILKIDDLFVVQLLKIYYKRCHNFVLPNYLLNLPITLNVSIHNHNTRGCLNIHKARANKFFTDGTIPHLITTLVNYSYENMPTHFIDYVCNPRYNKLKTLPRHCLREILSKIKSVKLMCFVKLCKRTFISTYIELRE